MGAGTGGAQHTRGSLPDLNFIKLGAANGTAISLLGPFFQTNVMKNVITSRDTGNFLLPAAGAVLQWWVVMLLDGVVTLKVVFGDNSG